MGKHIIILVLLSFNAQAMFISHRGVHQTYHRDGLTNTTCTAVKVNESNHYYLENTIESIEEAFNLGADMVELDVRPTAESLSSEKLAVFQDWTLDCRSNSSCNDGCKCNEDNECITNEQPWDYLKSLDLGHGYTFDNRQTYPFREQYFGAMPLFDDVLELLQKHIDKKS